MRRLLPTLMTLSVLGIPALRAADPETPVSTPAAQEQVEVTATKYEDDPAKIPQSMTVISGQDLRDRGATDLRSALALVAGVDIAPGGDGGPASAVPEMWGLREQDAYLLLVDGIPWGGVFNPQVATLGLEDVERIEILRGAAPVMYGTGSFIGVIQVIRYHPGQGVATIQAAAGSYGSGAIVASFDVGTWAGFASRLTLDAEQRDYPDPRTEFERGHVLWRNRNQLEGGTVIHFALEGMWINQEPSSPVPRTGTVLAPNVPLDTNYNPGGAEIDPRRNSVNGGFSIPKSYGIWSGLLSYAHSSTDALRGFVTDPTDPVFTANGSKTTLTTDEVYLDAHLEFTNVSKTQILVGVDYQYGKGHLTGGDFDYTINADGSNPPDGNAIPPAIDAKIVVKRNFGGLYGFAAWTPNWRWRVEGGLRLNLTDENRTTSVDDFDLGTFDSGDDSVSETRLGGSAGVTFTAWQKDADYVRIFTDYRNTYKPAAVDFGLDAEAEILDPESSESIELGVRTGLFQQRFEIEFSVFDMELENLVVPTVVNGFPALENAGAQKFKGAELEVTGRLPHDIVLRAVGSYHDAKFLDYQQLFDGDTVPTQLEGNRQEMTPEWLAGAGIVYAPVKGFIAHAEMQFTGSRYLNKRNTALTPQFTSWGMGVGYRGDRFTIRVDGTNLGDERKPVSESEFADEAGAASYYLLEARRIWLTFDWRF
jgi:outer membrane receptor protein involved in Fe transport